ncbi:MAG: sensor histidine kinase [Chloroflexi bacterium]|nr:MAG: sensor histidine kinase [Chloroflexota bacterium]
MNRLWVRLSLYFGLLVLAGVLVTVGLSRALVSDRVSALVVPAQLRATGGVVDTLADYYRDHGSWAGAEGLLRGVQAATPLWSSRLNVTLVDSTGRPVYRTGPGGGMAGPMWAERPYARIPIELDGETVGELQVRMGMGPSHSRPNADLPEQLSRLLLLLALGGGVVGITLSILASRNLTAPLSRLAAAAHDIGARNFSRRVELAGTDEVREVAQAFNEMADRLEQAEMLRRNLVADVAHELRTPLSVLQGNLRALLDDVYSLDKAEISRLYTQTRLLSRLVNDLHDLAQAEAGQLSLSYQTIDLAQLVSETVESHQPVAEASGITLQADIGPDLPGLPADEGRITQVLHNLIANALRHTPAGGAVTVRAAAAGGEVLLAVQDSGDGIAPEHLPYVFDRFYRTDRSRARDTGGVGLGLAIARAIVLAHGGTIEAASGGMGQGSTFTVRLPVER